MGDAGEEGLFEKYYRVIAATTTDHEEWGELELTDGLMNGFSELLLDLANCRLLAIYLVPIESSLAAQSLLLRSRYSAFAAGICATLSLTLAKLFHFNATGEEKEQDEYALTKLYRPANSNLKSSGLSTIFAQTMTTYYRAMGHAQIAGGSTAHIPKDLETEHEHFLRAANDGSKARQCKHLGKMYRILADSFRTMANVVYNENTPFQVRSVKSHEFRRQDGEVPARPVSLTTKLMFNPVIVCDELRVYFTGLDSMEQVINAEARRIDEFMVADFDSVLLALLAYRSDQDWHPKSYEDLAEASLRQLYTLVGCNFIYPKVYQFITPGPYEGAEDDFLNILDGKGQRALDFIEGSYLEAITPNQQAALKVFEAKRLAEKQKREQKLRSESN